MDAVRFCAAYNMPSDTERYWLNPYIHVTVSDSLTFHFVAEEKGASTLFLSIHWNIVRINITNGNLMVLCGNKLITGQSETRFRFEGDMKYSFYRFTLWCHQLVKS